MHRQNRTNLMAVMAWFAVCLSSTALASNLTAHLDGAEEVPPFETLAQGQAVFKVRAGTLSYKLIVANIPNVAASHIHCAPSGANGPVGVTLFAGAPTTVNGILTQGPILAPDGGNACGWVDVDDIIDALESGGTYVNVHSLQNLAGEIRGQVQ